MKTDFMTSRNHFLPLSQTTLLLVEAVFSSTGTYFSANPSFRLVKTSFLSTLLKTAFSFC